MTPPAIRIGEISYEAHSKLISPIWFECTISLFHDD